MRSPSIEERREQAGVRADGEHSFLVTRAYRDELLARSDEELLGHVRLVPHVGLRPGIKTYGIRRRSTLRLLGIRNGDTVHTVNGRPVRTDERLRALRRLLRRERVEVEITRRGLPVTLRDRIVDALP